MKYSSNKAVTDNCFIREVLAMFKDVSYYKKKHVNSN